LSRSGFGDARHIEESRGRSRSGTSPPLLTTKKLLFLNALIACAVFLSPHASAADAAPIASITHPSVVGAGAGKHVVCVADDEEYCCEEGLPMLAKILGQRHGFIATVIFPRPRKA